MLSDTIKQFIFLNNFEFVRFFNTVFSLIPVYQEIQRFLSEPEDFSYYKIKWIIIGKKEHVKM